MDASEYQQQASRTLIDRPGFDIADRDIMLVWNAIGLAGEAGEVAEHIKKGVFHQHGVDRDKLVKEIGDVLWYAAALCTKAGIDLGEVMQTNIDKLRLRYPDGYSSADSKRRVDVDASTPAGIEGVRANVDKALDHLLDASSIVETLDMDQVGEAITVSLALHIGSMQRLQALLKEQAEKVQP